MRAACRRTDEPASLAARVWTFSCMLLALPVACSVPLFRDCRWTEVHSFRTEAMSEARRIVLDCPSSAGTLRARFRSEGSGGELSLRLLDPAGLVRSREDVRGGTCDVFQQWPAQRGAWVVDLVATEFAGSYTVELCITACASDRAAMDGQP